MRRAAKKQRAGATLARATVMELSSRESAPVGLVTWRVIDGKGRGVVTTRACTAGTEVERAPVVILPKRDILLRGGEMTVLEEYLLYWSDEPERELAMGGGLLMFYNHSARPNVQFDTGSDGHSMSVTTLRDVASGEELLYDYGVPLWFTPAPDDR
ncbi:MAG: SET domain-containing protein-lysine N-methyltransferase [Gemmatimonadaceae bacterium]|nr:SET domain-containing protein-lysine N-methyltransferase [Gemmatimonadaceae bacterium]